MQGSWLNLNSRWKKKKNNFSTKYCLGYTLKKVSIICLEFKPTSNWASCDWAMIFGGKVALHTVGLWPPFNSLCLEACGSPERVPWSKHMVSGRKTLGQLGKNSQLEQLSHPRQPMGAGQILQSILFSIVKACYIKHILLSTQFSSWSTNGIT